MDRRCVVVGGGASGLAAAWFLRRLVPDASVIVLEARERTGGNVLTVRDRKTPIDAGPDALFLVGPAAQTIASALPSDEGPITPMATARRVLLAGRGGLVPMPEGLVLGVPPSLSAVAKTDLLSLRGKARAALDLLLPRDAPGMSLGAIVERRLGREVKDRLVEPMVGALYAADIDRLDPAILPFFASRKRSLTRAALGSRRPTGGGMIAPRSGMDALVRMLSAGIGPERIRTSSPVRAIERTGKGYRVITASDGAIVCDDVVVAIPPKNAAPLVAELDVTLADEIGSLRTTSTASILFAFPPGTEVPEASGVLVPRTEKRSVLAATFLGRKWPRENDEVLVRAVVGGARNPRLAIDAHDGDLVAVALADLRAYVPLPEPTWTKVVRYLDATPQPEPSHKERVQRIRALASAHEGLHLASAAYEGPGIAGCASQALALAKAIAARGARKPAAPRDEAHGAGA